MLTGLDSTVHGRGGPLLGRAFGPRVESPSSTSSPTNEANAQFYTPRTYSPPQANTLSYRPYRGYESRQRVVQCAIPPSHSPTILVRMDLEILRVKFEAES